MKKKIIMILIGIFIFLSMCGFKEDEDKVYDLAGLFTKEETEELQELCIEFAKATKLDAIVLTTADVDGASDCFKFATDFYMENGFGYEEDVEEPSGVVFVISVDPYCREVRVVAAGIGSLYINDEDIETILDEGYSYCTSGMYYMAEVSMIKEAKRIVEDFECAPDTDEVVEAWYQGDYASADELLEQYDYYSFRKTKSLGAIVTCLVASLVVAGISVLIMNTKYKNKMTANGGTYFENNSFVMHSNHDNFIKTDVRRVKIESSSGGGGHSSSSGMRSSGGSSFRSGGRKF